MTYIRSHRARITFILGVVLAQILASEAQAREAELIISQKADVETFDPSQSNNTTTHNVTINLFDTLVRLSDDGRDFVGELAESWKVVDPTTWQFRQPFQKTSFSPCRTACFSGLFAPAMNSG